MKAIRVHFIAATDTRPTRVCASAEGVASITRQYEFDGDESVRNVAQELATKYGWHGRWIEGGMPDGSTCFVLADSADGFTVARMPTASQGGAA